MAYVNPVKTLANSDDSITQSEMNELIKCKYDARYFIENYVKVQHPTRGAVLFKFYPYQKRVLGDLLSTNKNIILQPRQSGKTVLIVAYCLWLTIFNDDFSIGVAAHKGSGAKEIISRLKYAYESLPHWMKPAVSSYNVHDVEFDNGSSIVSQTTTENTFRGLSFSFLYLDEFAFVKPLIASEFWTSILPSLTAGGVNAGRMIITSTPNGSEGKFAELWVEAERGANGFQSIKVRNEEIPFREKDSGFKEEMLKTMSKSKYLQEYDCAFISDKGTLIQSSVLESLVPLEPIIDEDSFKLFREIDGRRLGISVDVGEGINQDYSVINCFDIDTLEQVCVYSTNYENPSDFTRSLIRFLEQMMDDGCKEIYYTVEGNPIGQTILRLLENSTHSILHECTLVSENEKRDGILMTSLSKRKGCALLKDMIEQNKLKIADSALISELKFFVRSGNSYKAETGVHDDLVMSVVIFCLMMDEISYMDDMVHDAMNSFDAIACIDHDTAHDSPMPMVF